MKLSTLLPLFASATLVSAASSAPQQFEECGTQIEPAVAAHARALQASGAYNLPPGMVPGPSALGGGPSFVVPLTFHVVRQSNGSGGISQNQLDNALIDANSDFAAAGIEFCVAGAIQYIDDDDFYFNIDTLAEINQLRSTNVVPNTINIYFTEELAYEQGGLCGISAFTFSTSQQIAMRNSCTATSNNDSTFSHELGHYFDLFHTHEPFYGEECVDGSNCDVAGDLVCDTPADPRLGFSSVDSSCQYIGGLSDNCSGTPYSPHTENLMSYSRWDCRDSFTFGQNTRALATLVNLRPELAQPICSAGVEEFCAPPAVNSSGQSSKLTLEGTAVASANNLTLSTSGLPLNQFAYYLNGQAQGTPITPPGSQGTFCLGGSVGRYNAASQIRFTGTTGQAALMLDLTQTPTSIGAVSISSGQTWYFQLWHRDFVAGASTSNFSNMLSVTFF